MRGGHAMPMLLVKYCETSTFPTRATLTRLKSSQIQRNLNKIIHCALKKNRTGRENYPFYFMYYRFASGVFNNGVCHEGWPCHADALGEILRD